MSPPRLRVTVFLQGTVLMHRSGLGCTREERVRQVREGADASVREFADYVPIGRAVEKVRAWARGGADVSYLSAHTRLEDVEGDRRVLRRFEFPDGPVHARAGGETYAAVAERVLPDVLVEDDCESIGGEPEMVSPHVRPEVREGRTWVVVPEFGGIDHLPDDPRALRSRS